MTGVQTCALPIFTFASTEEEQKQRIEDLARATNSILVTTVKDYKNQEFKDREYSQPAVIRSNNNLNTFIEIHDWDLKNKNSWQTQVYKLNTEANQCYGVFDRKIMYFKQLAKFTMDTGAEDFLVHKNLMYKGLIKKNYEHVISVHFER